MNKKENCQNCSEREQNIVVKRVVNQKSTSQEIVNQSGENSAYAENRKSLRKDSKRRNGRRSNVMACSIVMMMKNRK